MSEIIGRVTPFLNKQNEGVAGGQMHNGNLSSGGQMHNGNLSSGGQMHNGNLSSGGQMHNGNLSSGGELNINDRADRWINPPDENFSGGTFSGGGNLNGGITSSARGVHEHRSGSVFEGRRKSGKSLINPNPTDYGWIYLFGVVEFREEVFIKQAFAPIGALPSPLIAMTPGGGAFNPVHHNTPGGGIFNSEMLGWINVFGTGREEGLQTTALAQTLGVPAQKQVGLTSWGNLFVFLIASVLVLYCNRSCRRAYLRITSRWGFKRGAP